MASPTTSKKQSKVTNLLKNNYSSKVRNFRDHKYIFRETTLQHSLPQMKFKIHQYKQQPSSSTGSLATQQQQQQQNE
jgi:hypothetical protein